MHYSWGKSKRLSKLKRGNYYCVLALDHSLTTGPISGIDTIEDIDKWINFASKKCIPAVVLNPGIIDNLNVFNFPSIILQSMGMPNKSQANVSKSKIANIEKAISVDACAISVQINLGVGDLQNAIQTISEVVYQANKNHFPVLFMVNHADWATAPDFNYALRICAELGADLIKINLPSKIECQKGIKRISPCHPPVLLAGGDLSGNFPERVSTAFNLGFSGICIGRNIFQSENPEEVLDSIDMIFGDNS
jgi:class I fructose-bisphosphate aldolase/fructose-bisphosphate aldolase/2-amino-3,7-dideoxy-D-threo-hept-6-ulosonate synthase